MTANSIQFTKVEIQIAKYLFKHYKDRHNARQLARILGLNHAHVNKLCNLLAEKKLLVKERIGNSVYFEYDYDSKTAVKFMEYILSLEEFPEWLKVLLHCKTPGYQVCSMNILHNRRKLELFYSLHLD